MADEEMRNLGPFAAEHLAFLQKHNPQMVKDLRSKGELREYLTTFDRQIGSLRETAVQQLLDADPVPENATAVEKAGHIAQKQAIADEIITKEEINSPPADQDEESKEYRPPDPVQLMDGDS